MSQSDNGRLGLRLCTKFLHWHDLTDAFMSVPVYHKPLVFIQLCLLLPPPHLPAAAVAEADRSHFFLQITFPCFARWHDDDETMQ